MRPLRFVLVVFAGVAGIGAPAGAIDYPWCAEFADGAGVNCGFTTYEQCTETARGTGGYCALNNTYSPTAGAARPRQPARKHRSHKK